MSVDRTQLEHQAPQESKHNSTTAAIVNRQRPTTAKEEAPPPPLPPPIKSEVKDLRGNAGDLVAVAGGATATGGQTIQTRSVVKAETATCRVDRELQQQQQHHQEDERSPNDQEARLSYNRPQKYCAVCGDKAIACNFNAVTCESCKAFFRRNAFKEQRLRCLFENRCVIDRVTRRFCSKCRLLKCFAIGMKREWILTDEQKQIKRVKIMQNKRARGQQVQAAQTPVDFESGSESATPTSTRPTRPSSITSSLGGCGSGGGGDVVVVDQNLSSQVYGGSDNGTISVHDSQAKKQRPLIGTSDNMIENDNRHQVVVVVERRDAATDCSDLQCGHSRILPRYCIFAHECHFCSRKLFESTTATATAATSPYLQPNLANQNQHLPPGYHPAPPTNSAADYQHQQHPLMTHIPPAASGHTPFYSQSPVIVHHQGGSGRPHATPPQPPPPPPQYQARQVAVPNPSPPKCCLESATLAQHHDASTCQVAQQATSPEAALQLHVLESTSQASGDSQQQQVVAASLECDKQGPAPVDEPPADQESGVGVAAPAQPPPETETTPGDEEEEEEEEVEEEEEDEEESEEEGEEQNEEESSKESAKSDVTSRNKQQVAQRAAAAAKQAAVVASAAAGETSDSIACTSIEQLQEWRGETYCAPAGTESEICARVQRLGFSDTERQLIQEMIDATRLVFEPQERMSNDSLLDDIVFFCDAALRRLIKTVKQITAFRVLNMDDQIVLLKNACFKILLLRSSFHYQEEIEGWRDKSGAVLPLTKLKTEKCRNYEKHKAIMDKLAVPLRRDRLLMSFMILIILFDPTVSLKHSNSVQLDNMVYLYTLRKYLVGTQPEPLAKYERICETLQVINACNEEYNLFFSRNYQPEEITPLLVEIFDISINDIPM